MFGVVPLVSLALAALSSVSAAPISMRATPPSGWLTDVLESYTVYHTRYLALDCQDQHNSTFFATCCHPLLANEALSSRPSECIPSASASASASAAEPTSTVIPDDDDCDGDDGDDTSSSVAAATETAPTTTSTTTPTTTRAVAVASPTHTTTSTHKVATTTTTSKKATSTSSSTDDTVQTGGVATFFFQNGVAGACGKVNPDSALIAAIDADRYGNTGEVSSLCGQQVEITNTDNGKTVTVTIADACPTCDNANSIDLSTGAFTQIAAESTGEVPITWKFV